MTDAASCHDAAGLTHHIESRFHARHREQLPQLAKLAEMVEDFHAEDEGVPERLSHLLRQMVGEMEVHLRRDELVLFPAIRRGGLHDNENVVAATRADHQALIRKVHEIRRSTRDLSLPDGACSLWTELYAALSAFIDDLTEHMLLENDVLLPRLEGVARPPEATPFASDPERGGKSARRPFSIPASDTMASPAPAVGQNAPGDAAKGMEPAMDCWLPSLLTDTPQEGFDLAVSMARKAVTPTQAETGDQHAARRNPVHDPQCLIGLSSVVATCFATVAVANDYWRD